MKQFLTIAFITLIISLAIGTLLAFYQNNDRLTITVEAYDSITKEPIPDFTVHSFPISTILYDEKMAGRGRKVIEIRHFWFGKLDMSVKGYKSKSTIISLSPNKVVPFYLESKDPSIYDQYTPEELRNRQNKYEKEMKPKEKHFDMGEFFNRLNK